MTFLFSLRSVVLTLAAVTAVSAQDRTLVPVPPTQSTPSTNLPALATAALNGGTAAIQSLRTAGPAGLEALLTAAAPRLDSLRTGRSRLDDPGNAVLRDATDAVARQRDAWASGLYWFTDLDAARAEARRTGRPILSLRLLGHLDDEYSCANSRFFRTVLYANAAISQTLREKYVLHWKSVRPAPLLTIDMGDGRRIKRTITGNSIHYLLDADGRVLDALPGLYSPQAFLSALDRAVTATWTTAQTDPVPGAQSSAPSSPDRENRPSAAEIRAWHGREAHELCMEWLDAAVRAGAYPEHPHASRLEKDGQEPDPSLRLELAASAFPSLSDTPTDAVDNLINPPRPLKERQQSRFGPPGGPLTPGTANGSSGQWSAIAESPRKTEVIREFPFPTEFDPPKAMVERPVLQKTIPGSDALPAQDPASPAHAAPDTDSETESESEPAPVPLADRMTPALWSRIAEPLSFSVQLDEASRRLMVQKLPIEILTKSEAATGKPLSAHSPFGRQLARFEAAIARDMVRNEYWYHNRIHQWLEEDDDGGLSNDVEALNRRVYGDLFLTPDYDAWLGLVPEDTYTALEKDGCACDRMENHLKAR